MLRYKHLLLATLDPEAPKPITLRDLARAIGIPVPSLHNYVQFDTLPRIENVSKMAQYFGESISSLFSEDDDLTARLVALIRTLPEEKKEQLLQEFF